MSFEKALRIFRKKCENAGIKDDLRKKEFYEKPNAKRRRKTNEAKRRNQRALAKEKDMWNNYRSRFGRKS
jgi:small subunit ribosomal protein S21